MYSSYDFMLPFSGSLVLFFVLDRIVCSLMGLFWTRDGKLRRATSDRFLVSCFEVLCNACCSTLYSLLSLSSALLSLMLWVSVLLVLGSILYVTYEQAPWVWTDLIRAYNAFFGPLIQGTIIQILNLINLAFKGVVPLWNSLFFFVNRVMQGYLLPTLVEEAVTVGAFGAALMRLGADLCVSIFNWVLTVVVVCPEASGDACYDMTQRTMDLMTPMADLRSAATIAVSFCKTVCSPAGALVDILSYPLMDLNFAVAVHNLGNAILSAFIQLPDITALRCLRVGSTQPLLCTPDMDPVFSFLVQGIAALGQMLDNWIDVAYIVVQAVLGWSSHACDPVALVPPFLGNSSALGGNLFGRNQTVVVGLNDYLMAVTDGFIVGYYAKGKMRVASWATPINVSNGVAAVTYASSSAVDVSGLSSAANPGSSDLLGCSCVYDGREIQIQCSILPFAGLLANQTSSVPVFFQQGTAQQSLLCTDLDITVQSVRWASTRYTAGTGSQAGSNNVDATVWIVPRAGCDAESTVCDCFPFCMGVRLTGSQAAPIVLYSAEQWRNKVYMVRRDCNLQSTSSQISGPLTVVDGKTAASAPVSTTQAPSLGGLQFVVGSSISYTDNLLVTSHINRSMHPAYSTPTPAFLRNPAAPFVITGDTIFTSIQHGDGGYTVQIERLTGMTGNEYTLSVVSSNFPAYPPPSVPSAIFMQYPRDHLTIPYARQATLAVSSQDYVFYAVNPDTRVYGAYLAYCQDSTRLPQFGLIMTSSFSPIRIWRVDAYRRCNAAGCGVDLVSQVDVPDAFSNGTDDGDGLTFDCLKTYNRGITQLEYVNEYNIAVTVAHTDVNASFIEYRTYWLNVQTMQLNTPSEGLWTAEAVVTTTPAYSLCPSMQVLPELGTMAASLVNAGVLLVQTVLGGMVYFPGILHLWSSGTVCPLQTHGHSVLQQCGSEAFSLDDFFSSLQTATDVFWGSLTMLSAAVGGVAGGDASGFVQDALDGVARYGAGSIDLWTARFQVLAVMKAGPSSVIQAMPATLMSGGAGWLQSGLKVSSNTLGWAMFGYNAMLKTTVTILQNVLLNQPVGPGRAWQIVVNTLDQMRDDYDRDVVDNMLQSCAGVSLMMGLGNPWAVFIYQQCVASNTIVSAGMDLTLSVFNLAPFTQCMCSGSAGRVFGDYAMQNCVPQASTRLRPVLLGMIQSATIPNGQGFTAGQALCRGMINYTKTQLVSSLQPWFDAEFASMDALASSFDYSLSWLDPDAGDCLNYNQDPDVVVIMPYPVDYFQACGSTSLCQAKCAGPWNAFEQSLTAAASSTQRVTVDVESLFFPSMTVDSFNPMNIMALLEPSGATCSRVCGGQNGGQTNPCVAVGGVATGVVAVQFYCVPALMTATVYRTLDTSLEWKFPGSAEWAGDLVQLQFADDEGCFLVALVSTGAIYMGGTQGNQTLATLNTQTLDLGVLVISFNAIQVMSRPPYASINVNMLYRQADGQITARALHRQLVFDTSVFPDPRADLVWWDMGVASSFFAQLQGYAPSQISAFSPAATFLLLPLSPGLPVNLWTVEWSVSTWGNATVSNGVRLWTLTSLSGVPQGLGSLLSSGETLSQNCYQDSEQAYIAFSAAPPFQSTAWLSQVRVSGATASAYTSQQVQVEVQTTTNCSVQSCVGCPDGEVQDLCDAAQACTVINCIGTPVNMRQVLCQLGQTIADQCREMLAALFGVWEIFVDMFMVIMDLSLQSGLTGVAITFPDDSFFGYVCTVKDQQAHFISIFTSALNAAVQMGHTAITYLTGGAHQIDSNFNAMATMPLTALTSFLNQVFLFPLYGLIVSQKVMMCRVEGVLAMFNVTGFAVTVGDATMQAASDAAVGHCLTQNFVTQSANPADSGNAQSTARIVASVAQSAALAMIPQLTFSSSSLETVMHCIDAALSYLMGVLSGLSDLLASMDMAHCKMPDYFLNETVFCSCGDYPYAIPEARRQEGLAGAGFWCTGTLSLLDVSNQPFVIYNPFSYAQLQELAAGADEYLACMSSKTYLPGQTNCNPPTTPILQAQGVNVLTVLTACKGNYMLSQWDKGAYILFNRTVFAQQVQGASYPSLSGLPAVTQNVGACLANPATRSVCLQDYMAFLGTDPEIYWSYDDSPQNTPDSRFIDACQVFTGPASQPIAQAQTFRACLDQYPDSNCQLSSSLWTPQSDNAVPVAYKHAAFLRHEQAVLEIVGLKYQEARELVMAALQPLNGYTNKDLQTIFFSPEGDIMHQMMDCVFMGPYSKVNYWPSDSHGLLPLPAWFRDDNGSSRAVDPRVCVLQSTDTSPPYSCGSHARQAVIRYFFRDYLPRQQNVTMGDIVASMATELAAAWNDTAGYMCLCADNVTHNFTCCSVNGSGWLPVNLDVPYQTVPTNVVLRSLTSQLQTFYRYALEMPQVWVKYMDPPTLAAYDWSASPLAASLVMREGLYRADRPVIQYDATEARAPLVSGLWHQCHGLLSQIFFTIPMQNVGGQWTPRNLPTELGGVQGLNSFIASAVQEAFMHSPLYRHYNVSYVPSDSRMCMSNRARAGQPRALNVTSYMALATSLLNTGGWPTLPSYGTDAFQVGGCFCGWEGNATDCQPPAPVCQALPSLCPSFSVFASLQLLRHNWVSTWPCPALQLSDHSGAMDSGEMNDWLAGVPRGYSISGDNLLRRGRGGLRVGNFVGLANWSKSQPLISPALPRVVEPHEAALPYCAADYDAAPDLLDPEAELRSFVANLFPVAQGVYEQSTIAYCLRYAVESALLQALSLGMSLFPDLGRAYASQRLIADLWRTRCEGQIALLALCKGLDVYHPPVSASNRLFPCPFSVSTSSSSDVYMTPGCLVHSGGLFYDPCNCPAFACGPSKPYFNAFTPSCQLPFDPRNMTVDSVPLGGWKVSPMEVFQQASFVRSLLDEPDAAGNVPRGGDWASSEGFLNETGRHCDMLTDWWPQGQTLPVGYHATVPCTSDETGYQTFDSAFAVERQDSAGQYTVVRMVYQHDLTRNASSVDSQVGSGGVCRASNLGLPMINVNEMRICTRQQTGPDTLDAAIPGIPPMSPLGQAQCSGDSASVPWFEVAGVVQDSALYSVGTVPNMPTGGTTYPASTANTFGVGPRDAIQQDLGAGNNGWGPACSDFAILECVSTSNCPSGYFCLLPAGVCMNNDFDPAEGSRCYRHDMCLQGGMCDGTGRCVQGYVTYLNTVGSPIEATVFAEKCDQVNSDTYYTDGSSPWEYVPDWLTGHGMCSNKNWYYYSLNLINAQACGSCSGGSCSFNARTCSQALNGSQWWPAASAQPKMFAVNPTVCDRDYEHLRGPNGAAMVGCTPNSAVVDNQVTDAYNAPYPISYSQLFRNYQTDGVTSIAKMPFYSYNKTGFLGYNTSVLATSSIVNCENFQNCYAYPFTFNGAQVSRTYWTQNGVAQPYNDDDIFRCGVTAYYDSSSSLCRLDTKVLPLYTALCQSPSIREACGCTQPVNDPIGCTPVVDAVKAQGICSNILTSYTANYDTIQANTANLQALFNVFLQSDSSLVAQVSGSECFEAIHAAMQTPPPYPGPASSVYFPFDFALYEIPLAWIYQCVYVAGVVLGGTTTTITCQKYEDGKSLAEASLQADTSVSGQAFDFTVVRAGYRRADVLNSLRSFAASIASAMPSVASVDEFKTQCTTLGVSPCDMVPYCANRQDWIPNSQMDTVNREFLAALYQTACNQDVKTFLLDLMKLSYGQAIQQLTLLKDFSSAADPSLQTVMSLINASVTECIGQAYNVQAKWPFSVNFPCRQSVTELLPPAHGAASPQRPVHGPGADRLRLHGRRHSQHAQQKHTEPALRHGDLRAAGVHLP